MKTTRPPTSQQVNLLRSDAFRQHVFAKASTGPGCWIWQGAKISKGYGHIRVGNQVMKAHRVSFIMHGGDPNVAVVRHTCDNPNCVNPAHLLPGTQADNIADCESRSRNAAGEKHGMARLKTRDILAIRRMLREGYTGAALARIYGVNRSTISLIGAGKSWRSVPQKISQEAELAMAA